MAHSSHYALLAWAALASPNHSTARSRRLAVRSLALLAGTHYLEPIFSSAAWQQDGAHCSVRVSRLIDVLTDESSGQFYARLMSAGQVQAASETVLQWPVLITPTSIDAWPGKLTTSGSSAFLRVCSIWPMAAVVFKQHCSKVHAE